MFIYFDRNGVLQEVINDKAARLGDLNANEIYVYVDEVELDDIWLTLKRPDGTLSVEKSFIANKVVREIPYDPKRDMKFFKDFKEYEFYKFTITDEITVEGVYQATIRMTYEDTLSALGVLVFKAETGVIKSDQNITQAQYDYLIWYVGSWQGQIGDLEEAMGIAEADILGLQNRMNVAEQDINKIEDGTTVVDKALKDDLGNTIKSTYIKDIFPTFSPGQNALYINWLVGSGVAPKFKSVVLPKATPSADGLLAKEDKVKINNIATDIASMGATKQSLSEKNQINGYAGLDNNAKIPSSLLPDSVLGQLEYKGTFTPTAYPSSPEKGWFYISIGNGVIGGLDYKVGDWAVYNGSSWDKVDNTDAVMSVNGKLGVVVLNGTDIPVGNGDTWTIEQRIVNIYAELNNRYTKAQTYSQNEIEQRLTDLLGMANLQDILIGSYTNGQTVLASDLSAYNFVIVLGKDLENTYTGTFKPSEIVSGNVISLSPTVYLTRGATDFTITTPTSIKLWGIKLDGITADEIGYGEKTVEDALNEVFEPEYTTATHVKLTNEITATNNVEIIDDTGTVLEVEGNEPTNLVVNGDLLIAKPSPNENEPLGFLVSPTNTNLSLTGGIFSFTPTVRAGGFYTDNTNTSVIGNKYYYFAYVKTSVPHVKFVTYGPYFGIEHIGNGTWQLLSFISTKNATNDNVRIEPNTDSVFGEIQVDYIGAYNVSDMIKQGIKNDNGVLFANLTNEEIKSQLDIWVQNGFPTVVEKLVSKSDNLLDGTFNKITSLESENLIANSDLLIDSNSDGVPDGFTKGAFASSFLSNGVWTLIADGPDYAYSNNIACSIGDTFYSYAYIKSDSSFVGFYSTSPGLNIKHSGSGLYQLISMVNTKTNTSFNVGIDDSRDSGWTPIEVDKIGAFNITDLVSRGILPSGLTNAQYKELLDNKMFDNVPLRETDYISVEPSKAYKLIKVSANEVTHKVIEYTTDNQVVKVTPVVYTTNKFTFTTHALTAKVKIVSDMLERPANLVVNGDLLIAKPSPNENEPLGFNVSPSNTNLSLNGGIFSFTPTVRAGGFYTDNTNTSVIGNKYYYFAYVKTSVPHVKFVTYGPYFGIEHIGNGTWQLLSFISTKNATNDNVRIEPDTDSVFGEIQVDYIGAFNVSDMQLKGVKNDSGALFSRLTNDEIKDQMDLWVQNGFPDHVIHALYPNGVDSAIALKYNDADDVFRPQQIDELPLNLTLRSGEYWQDGYVIKQNGNAEYYPLDTKFSAWNYGQLEAIYASGVPADFKIQYAQNTAAQVKTTQEFLVEAREQIDYVTDGYDSLVEKLGDAIFSDKYDSYAGITSDTYEYYTLEGIKEGNTLAIEGAGQSIQNLLPSAMNASTTVKGVTVTYDSNTGIFTVNGTSTGAANIVLKTGMTLPLAVGSDIQLLRYYESGTIDLNGSYTGYLFAGTSVSNRINENSESLYDPYINGVGQVKEPGALSSVPGTSGYTVIFQFYKAGMVFTDFKFKLGLYSGLQLRPYILPGDTPAKSNVTVYNRTANMLNMPTALNIEDSGITVAYDPLVQEFLLSGTATATKDISLSATFDVLSGDRLSIKRLYQSGDITAAGGTLPRLKLVNSTDTTIVYNDIYKMTAPEGETPTPDVSFNTGTAPADDTLTLKLGITNGQVFENYRFRLMIHDKSTDIGYVAYRRDQLGNMSVGANERAVLEFKAIPYGILEFVADSESLNLLFADGITDLTKTYLEYNAGIISPNRKISELTTRADIIDNPFRNKVIAVWGDSRESNNPTSDPSGVGDQQDTSWPALLAKKLNATVLNYGLSGGAWAENTVQQDAASAIVNRVQTEDVSASADVIIISSMNDFKLASPLGSPLPENKDKTTFYGAMRLTYDRLAAKYPGKKIVLVLPQKRYDETVNYGGGSYYHYLKAQVEVANEYGIPVVDLYNNMPGVKGTAFYDTYMLNDTHWSAAGNDRVAELVARELIGNGNKGNMNRIPPIPTTDGTYTLKVTITGGIPVFSWVID